MIRYEPVAITNLRFLPSTLVVYLLDRRIDVLVPVLRGLLELSFFMAGCPSCRQPDDKDLE